MQLMFLVLFKWNITFNVTPKASGEGCSKINHVLVSSSAITFRTASECSQATAAASHIFPQNTDLYPINLIESWTVADYPDLPPTLSSHPID